MKRAESFAGLLGPLVLLGSIVTVLVAFWLLYVVVAVLPERDPSRIRFWTGVAIAFLGYGILCLASLALRRSRVVRGCALIASILAMAWASSVVGRTLLGSSDHFEGYLLLMGIVLGGLGLLAFVHATLSTPWRPAAPPLTRP